ncbi:hypothetical protein MOSE0_H04764 [Monosporozyma servazzii]
MPHGNNTTSVLYYVPTMQQQHQYTNIQQQHASMNINQQRKHVLPSFNNLLTNIYQIDYSQFDTNQFNHSRHNSFNNNSFNNYTYNSTHTHNSIGAITPPPTSHSIPQYITHPPQQTVVSAESQSTPRTLPPHIKKQQKINKRTKSDKKGAKPKKIRKNYVKARTNSIKDIITSSSPTKKCFQCQEANTPEWRLGPYGNRSLCNACGLYYRRLIQRFDLKRANLIMRFNKFVKPINNMRQIPNQIDIPHNIINQLDMDPHLDSNYNNID